jgi:ABC-type transporter Mla subunit MlaD
MTTTSPRKTPSALDSGRSLAAESLLQRLDDPKTAAALHQLLDNAELLAMGVTMLDELLQRSETIAGNVSSTLAEVRASAGPGAEGTAADLGSVLKTLKEGLPTIAGLLHGPLGQPRTIAALDTIAGAVTDGLGEARTRPPHKLGIRGLLAELRDPETARGIQALLCVARSLGRRATG